jgi:hypothetical protein
MRAEPFEDPLHHALRVLTYTLLAYREERHMLDQFGEQYCIYQKHVPMFSPGQRGWRQLIERAQMGF